VLKKLLGIILPLALLFTALPTVIVPQAALAVDGTTSLHIVKYAPDGTTILDEETISYTTMKNTLPVLGDGTTHYYMQGPTFDNSNLWDPAETLNLKDKGAAQGTAVKALCDLVGGMSAGDTVKIQALDGYNEEFFWDTVYEPDTRLGAMGISWGTEFDAGPLEGAAFTDGMQLVFFAGTTNAAGQNVFGNDDMRNTLPEANWHYFDGQPSCNGLSIKQISDILIYTGESGWNISMSGARNYTMTQGEFESGVACHPATWTTPYSTAPVLTTTPWLTPATPLRSPPSTATPRPLPAPR
jgi:hypothetical protein